MKSIILFLFTFLVVFIANGTSQIAIESKEIKQIIEQFFSGMKNGDTASMRSLFYQDVDLRSVLNQKGEVVLKKESLNDLIKAIGTPHPEIWNEEIRSWSFSIEEPMATVVTDYEFFVGTTYSHCGTNVFQLLKSKNGWKIFAITDTRKKECYLSSKEFNSINRAKISEREIHLLLDTWHKYPVNGDLVSFFDFMDDDFIYLGTDKTERWEKNIFYDFCEPHFKKTGGAWNFKPYNRYVYLTNDYQYAWFEETLDTWMGVCRGSGVLIFTGESWKIKHYNLCVTIDNDKIQQFIGLSK